MGKTGPACSICQHERRSAIDIALTHKVPARVIAARFQVSRDAVWRHGKAHLSPAMRAALLAHRAPTAVDLDALRTSETEGLLTQLVHQRARLQGHAEIAADLGDVKAAVAAENAITGNLALVGKLLGQLVSRHEIRSTSILISPDYLKLRATLVEALKPYPDAAQAVGRALHQLETQAAADITDAARKPLAPRVIEHRPAPAEPTPQPIPPPPY